MDLVPIFAELSDDLEKEMDKGTEEDEEGIDSLDVDSDDMNDIYASD